MNRSIVRSIFMLAVFVALGGCSLDRVQIISHPSSAKPGDTISVVFCDVYLILSTTPTTGQAYNRDSLHVAYGLPQGWSVLSSDYYIAGDLNLSHVVASMNDPALITGLIQDSIPAYAARKSSMAQDIGWSGYFGGKTFEAHNAADNDSIPVSGSAVGQWLAYSAKINELFPAGTKMDTALAISSLPLDSATLKTIPGDTIWVKTLPIVCFAVIVAPKAQRTDTLLYFAKTGPKPATGISILPNFDKGDMTYAPIVLAPQNAVLSPIRNNRGAALLRVAPAALTRGARITMSICSMEPWRLSVFDAAGKTVRSFSSTASPAGNRIIWDGTSIAGDVLRTGTYYLRLTTALGLAASQSVRIVK